MHRLADDHIEDALIAATALMHDLAIRGAPLTGENRSVCEQALEPDQDFGLTGVED